MASAQNISPATVQRMWDAHGLQPHRTETFKLSRDKRFVEKLTDVVRRYLNPPRRRWCCLSMRRARSKHWAEHAETSGTPGVDVETCERGENLGEGRSL
jgi:hypothetical protein